MPTAPRPSPGRRVTCLTPRSRAPTIAVSQHQAYVLIHIINQPQQNPAPEQRVPTTNTKAGNETINEMLWQMEQELNEILQNLEPVAALEALEQMAPTPVEEMEMLEIEITHFSSSFVVIKTPLSPNVAVVSAATPLEMPP